LTACSAPSETSDEYQAQEEISTISDITTSSKKIKSSSVEEIVKNDLEIDGVHVTLPCTISELLEGLGSEYRFDDVNRLLYNDELTPLWIVSEYNNEEMIKTIGCTCTYNSDIKYDSEKGILTLNSVDGNQPYSIEEITESYNHLPNIVTKCGDNKEDTRIQYYAGNDIATRNYVIQCTFTDSRNGIIVSFYRDDESQEE
jgi:hypothetical protein